MKKECVINEKEKINDLLGYEGLKIIQHHFNILKNNVYCIGDSWNDLPMIKSIENSFTFTYSPQDVMEEAKYIVNNLKECIDKIQKDA